MSAQDIMTEHLDIWTTAQQPKKSGGRGRGRKANDQSLYGIKKLRELILDLAVRGKLVEQNPEDEPASVLLEKIVVEKARLIKEKKIKKQKKLPEITEEEKSFALPDKWEWVRLGSIGDWGAGATPNRKKSTYYEGETPWFKSGELEDNEHLSISEETVTLEALKECSLRQCFPGDVLIAMYGATIGKLAILEKGATTNQAVCACTCYSGIFNRYLFCMLKAWRQRFTKQGAGGAQPNIFAALTRSADHESFTTAWEESANHFDLLFTTEQSIDQLQQTILQLAVMGKLVPQNPEDEPASLLLEKIAKEKVRLLKEAGV